MFLFQQRRHYAKVWITKSLWWILDSVDNKAEYSNENLLRESPKICRMWICSLANQIVNGGKIQTRKISWKIYFYNVVSLKN